MRELAAGVGVELPPLRVTGADPVLPSVFRVGTAAAVTVGAVTATAAKLWGGAREAEVDVREAAVAFRDERHFEIDGVAQGGWAPLSGDYRSADGWVRLHCNFDHHRDAALVVLGLPLDADRDAVARACAGREAVEIEEAVTAAGGCAAAMRSAAEWRTHPQGRALAGLPLVGVGRIDVAGRGPDHEGTGRPESGGGAERSDGGWSGRAGHGDEGTGRGRGDAGSVPGERDAGGVGRGSGDDEGPGRLWRGGEGLGRGAVGVERLGWGRGGDGGSVPGERDAGGVGRGKGGAGRSGWMERGGERMERGRPLGGLRVLDLTRVIAGPVATRTLAAHGAQVLRVGAGHLPEVPGVVIGTAFGKRSCHLDLRTPAGAAALRDLVAEADVFVQSYRPGALEALGFGPRELAAIRPGIVCVDVSAYGSHGPWAGRRGFDSLVQMVCGIAHEGGDGSRPLPLPAQVLDHATGYLAAFGAMAALLRRAAEGGSWRVEVSLARTALWLDSLGRVDGGDTPDPEVADLLREMDSPFGRLTYVRPPGTIDGASPYWASPPPGRGKHPPAWW
ncbi:CoA transferase [Streptosporangium sp. NPDC051022]|uniref:CoA transferase n=1 Tax=Streptosporangium sp. NPDC051022 TaxID=3155752 RepID=UPI003412B725